jgi:hypothetical protein
VRESGGDRLGAVAGRRAAADAGRSALRDAHGRPAIRTVPGGSATSDARRSRFSQAPRREVGRPRGEHDWGHLPEERAPGGAARAASGAWLERRLFALQVPRGGARRTRQNCPSRHPCVPRHRAAPPRPAGRTVGRSRDGPRARTAPAWGIVRESEIEETGTGDAAQRIGQAPTTDVTDPERSSRNTAAAVVRAPGKAEPPRRPVSHVVTWLTGRAGGSPLTGARMLTGESGGSGPGPGGPDEESA